MYRPPKESNLITFIQDLTFFLKKHLSTYDKVVVMGDFNTDVKEVTNQSLEKLNSFYETFGVSNLVKGYTCYSETHRSSIDLILTNKTFLFELTKATETGISDVHLLISTYMKTQTTRLKSKQFQYRDYKRFDEKTFLRESKSKKLTQNSISSNDNYEYLSYQFADVVNKHALLKTSLTGQ